MLVVYLLLLATRRLSTRQNGLKFRGQLQKRLSPMYWQCDTEGEYKSLKYIERYSHRHQILGVFPSYHVIIVYEDAVGVVTGDA